MQTSRRSKPAVLLFEHPDRTLRRTPLRDFWRKLADALAPGQAVTCLVTTDEVLRDLNTRFRGKPEATDVLSFPSGDAGQGLGEIAISLDRAAAQASALGHATLGHTTEDELHILMLHGLLHLTGMDHETDAGEMASVEARWRRKLGLPLGLIERVHA
jgi:probable rRNA maturation factor